jgi:hypothetical protein
MTSPSASPLPDPCGETGTAADPREKVNFLSVYIKNGLFSTALIWAFLGTCFYLLRFSLLPFLEGARGWLDSLL